ncbi:MAG: Gfo/Idh/MocA family oxidoreductase, partial [Proteobacteria bacterium]|nr:Gfo/Idh/MocA family oxidoreductase [Pseudomonadota bacterium]
MNKNRAIIRLGLIGAGPWGQNYIKTITGSGGLGGVTLSRLASRNPQSAGLVDGDCRVSEDWRDLLDAGDLDGVIIATPPQHHAKMTLAAIDAGIAVLVEKPMTFSTTEAEAVLNAATAKNAIVRVNHIHLYSAAWQALKREAASLGPLTAISTVAGGPGPNRADVPVLWDWGSHDVAMCIDLTGRRPDTVKADIVESGKALALELNFGPVTARIAISNKAPEKQRLLTAVYAGGELIYDDRLEG